MARLLFGRLVVGTLLAVAGGAAVRCAAQTNGPAAAQVRALEYKWADAEARKDNLTLDALFDNALIFVEYDGTLLSKAAYLTKIRMAQPGVVEVATESMTVYTFGTTAVVIGIYHEKGVDEGRAYLRRRRFLDTWAYKNGKWVCIAAAAMPLQR
jgi:ketosteroid isomerase-like protein